MPNSMRVEIRQWKGTVRAPRGKSPVVRLDLGLDQRIVKFEITAPSVDEPSIDWHWTAWVQTELGEGR